MDRRARQSRRGFTLIELSIVLVIIGLIVGGVLTGQSLIAAAAVRAQISQIEKYNTAANAFRDKYGYLPGDIKDPDASRFGFAARGTQAGQGDGNGVLQGGANGYDPSSAIITGEEGMFWVDLSVAHMMDGGFSVATPTALPTSDVIGSAIGQYLPQAKIGSASYVYAWGGAMFYTSPPGTGYTVTPYTVTGSNYLGIMGLSDIEAYNAWPAASAANLSVAQAYAIDRKMDDGLPTTGRVLALGIPDDDITWADGSDYMYNTAYNYNTPYGTYIPATPASSTSCFDDSNTAGGNETYSLSQNSGAGINCYLSFKMQAGD